MENEPVVNDTPNVEDDDQIVETPESEPGAQPEDLDAAALEQVVDDPRSKKELIDANRRLFARAKTAEGFVKLDGKWVKAPKDPKPVVKVEPKPNTGELDETQLDYLDLKGITDSDEIDIIQKVMQKTGQTVRQTLKDEYVQAKLKDLREQKEVKNALPTSTRRAGSGASNNLELALDKFEKTGELPDDFELRKAVVNAKAEKENTNKPAWR